MTCIVGLIHNDKVYIGGDSASTGNYQITNNQPKVFKVGDFIFGCTTSFRMIQLLRYSFTPPPKNKKVDIHEYLCTDFVNAIIKLFKENDFITRQENQELVGGTFLIGYKNRLFKIDEDFSVQESVDTFDSCGSGQEFALGALKAVNSLFINNPENLIRTALMTAEHFDQNVKAPFHIIKT